MDLKAFVALVAKLEPASTVLDAIGAIFVPKLRNEVATFGILPIPPTTKGSNGPTGSSAPSHFIVVPSS